jgi:hypothetical protein
VASNEKQHDLINLANQNLIEIKFQKTLALHFGNHCLIAFAYNLGLWQVTAQ